MMTPAMAVYTRPFVLGRRVLAILSALGFSANVAAADLLLINGNILSMNAAWAGAEAMAIAGDRIEAVGTTEELQRLYPAATRVVDLAGKTVLPGFHDLHVHPMGAGSSRQGCVIEQGADLPTLLDRVAACVSATAAGKWVVGGQWDASALGVTPVASLLDEVAPDNPVVLTDTSGHSRWANTRAMEASGITAETPDPDGGIIERTGAGAPSGVFRESAAGLLVRMIPPPSKDELTSALAWALDTMLSYGITSYTEAATGYLAGAQAELEAYKALGEAGGIRQRARVCITWSPGTGRKEDNIDEIIARRNLYASSRVTVDCVKIFLDGVPTDSHTAAMLEPYAHTVSGRKNDGADKGLLLVEQAALNAAVAKFDAMGLSVKFHAAGDAAVRAGLDAVAFARAQNGFTGKRHSVGHCTFVAREDLSRGRSIGATYELSPYLWSPTPINDDITHAVGDPRIDRVWPFRDLLAANAPVVVGSDWAVVPSVNPWPAIESLVTRQRMGGSDDAFGAPEAISVQEALELFTVNSARHMGRDQELGQIAPGMLADLVIVDRNPLEIPATDLHTIRVLGTIIAGEAVYGLE